jgi:hypothetical protein
LDKLRSGEGPERLRDIAEASVDRDPSARRLSKVGNEETTFDGEPYAETDNGIQNYPPSSQAQSLCREEYSW